LEKQFLSGEMAGKLYIRFQGGPKLKHKNVCTVKQAVIKDAGDRGIDPDVALAEFEQLKKEIEDKKEADRMAKGKVPPEMAEKAVNAFEAKFGKLEAGVVPKIAGWSFQSKWLENSQQTQVTYYGPDKTPYGTVKAVEVVFGIRLLNGENVDCIDKARADFIEEHGSLNPGYNPLRRTADGTTFKESITAGAMEKVAEVAKVIGIDDPRQGTGQVKKRRRDYEREPLPSDYIESAALSTACGDPSKVGDDAPDAARALDDVRAALLRRGFQSSTELLRVCTKEPAANRPVDAVAGIYYQMGERLNGRPFFQWVRACEKSEVGLACAALYIYWVGRWEIGSKPSSKGHCVAFCQEDRPTPAELERPWSVLREDWWCDPGA